MAVVGGEDATPEAPFRNVPRRRRSAARPPKEEEELGGDATPGRGAPPAPAPPSRDVEGPAVAPSAACDKKRPASDRGGDETHVRRAEKRHRPLRAEDAKNGGGGGALGRQTFSGGAPPAPSRGTDVAATAASASSSREQPADWLEKERIRKGKMPAQPSPSVVPRGGKLMADAISSHGVRSKNRPKSKKRKDRGTPFWYGMGRDGQSTSAAGSDVDHSFFKMGTVVSDMLRATLASLGVGVDDDAAAPERVYGRLLSRCDRNTHQSRLQMSCKSWRADRGEYPLCAFLTEAEKKKADSEGLMVNAYDRRGKKYEMTIRYLGSNRSYRLINQWGPFLKDNGLVVTKAGAGPKHVMLDLWLFRPPGGEIGMVILHYFKGDAAHADAALEEEEDRRAIRRRGNDDDATAAVTKEEAASPPEADGGAGGSGDDAGMEDVAGGASGKVEDDGGGVKSEAASAPSPSEQPDDGGAKAAAGEQQAGPLPSPAADGTKMEEEAGGAPVETAAQFSPEASGAAKVEAGCAPGEADGTKKAEKEASAGTTEAADVQSSASDAGGAAKKAEKGASAVTTEAAAVQSSASDAGGAAKKAEKEASAGTTEAAAVQSSASDAGGAAKKAVVDKEAGAQGCEDAVQAPSPPVDGAGGAKKATFMFGLTQCDLSGAYTLVMLSQGHWA